VNRSTIPHHREDRVDRLLAALDPPVASPDHGERRVARIVVAYRAAQMRTPTSAQMSGASHSWRSTPGGLRLAGSLALLLGMLAGWAVPRPPEPTPSPAETQWLVLPAPPLAPSSLAQLYLDWIDDPDGWPAAADLEEADPALDPAVDTAGSEGRG
jgi:hypothetical protein